MSDVPGSSAAGATAVPGLGADEVGFYRRFLGAMAAAVYACDAEGRVTYFNEAAAELWGRRPEIGKDLWCGSWRIFQVDGSPLALESCPMAIALKEGRSVRGVEIVVERPDGTRRRVLPHPDPMRDASGAIVGAVNILVDVTAQREAERAEALLAAIVDSSDDAIISKTLEGWITSWNAGARRIFGYTAEEIVGRHITTLIPEERRAEEDRIIAKLRRGERIEHFETVRVAKDGRRVDISLTVSPVRDRSGRLIGASKVARDVTEQVRAKRELAESETRLRTLLSLLPVGVCACDAEGRITFYSKRAVELWGREPERLDSRFWEQVPAYWPDGTLIGPGERLIAVALREGRSFRDVEIVVERPDGARFHASVNIGVLRDEAGRILGAIGVFEDVSEHVALREALKGQRQALEEAVAERTAELEESHRRLRHSERMAALGTLSAGLGHDMGNLLLPVRVSIEALGSAALPQELRAEVERIRTSAQYLQQLANGLRMMALDPQRSGPAEPLRVKAWWADARALVKNALPRGVELEAEVSEDAWVAMARPALTQVVFNLAQNAGEALRGRADGRVRITAERKGDEVVVIVEDNGPGMTQEVLNRCMEPFYTTKPRGISTGLGLVLVGGLVREAGGTVQIRSEPGRGAAFRVGLPALEPRLAEREGAAPRGYAVVDIRDPRLRSLVSAELRRVEFEVLADTRGRVIDVAVADGCSPLSPEMLGARRVVLFGERDGHPSKVNAIGRRPRPEAIRNAIRAAAEAGAAAGEAAR